MSIVPPGSHIGRAPSGSRRQQNASEVLAALLEGDMDVHPKRSQPVRFRNPDGKVGRRDDWTHWLHWYPAKMFHRIPRQILQAVPPATSNVLLDPFCGSGTVLLEGAISGYQVIGIDVNPIARLISRVKTTPIAPKRLRRYRAGVFARVRSDNFMPPPDPVLDYWFKPEARAALARLARAVDPIKAQEVRDFYRVTLSSIIRRVSLADPAIAPPVRLNTKRAARATHRYRQALDFASALTTSDVYDLFGDVLSRNLDRMARLDHCDDCGSAVVLDSGLHAAATGLSPSSVDLIVTSPPYCGAQKYVRSLRLEMLCLGIDPHDIAEADRRTLGTERLRLSDRLPEAEIPQPVRALVRRISLRNPTRGTMASATFKGGRSFQSQRVSASAVPWGIRRVSFAARITSRAAAVDTARYFSAFANAANLPTSAVLVDKIPSRAGTDHTATHDCRYHQRRTVLVFSRPDNARYHLIPLQ